MSGFPQLVGGGSGGSMSFVQSIEAATENFTPTNAVTLAATAAGDTLVALFSGSDAISIEGLSPGTWTQALRYEPNLGSGTNFIEQWVCPDAPTGTTTVTATASGSANSTRYNVCEFSGSALGLTVEGPADSDSATWANSNLQVVAGGAIIAAARAVNGPGTGTWSAPAVALPNGSSSYTYWAYYLSPSADSGSLQVTTPTAGVIFGSAITLTPSSGSQEVSPHAGFAH